MSSDQGSEIPDFESVDYAASPPRSEADSEQPGSERKKRKAWGQPIPEFEKIIGPRKRAKTQAERTQRAHERTLRNRRAAAQSRDKKQAQFAAMEKENQALREQLAQYEARFGALAGDAVNSGDVITSASPSINVKSYPSPSSETTFEEDSSGVELATPAPLNSIPGPVLSHDTPMVSSLDVSHTLAPSLQLDADIMPEDSLYQHISPPAMSGDYTDATQYSAAVLSDPQCPASEESTGIVRQSNSKTFFHLNFHLINLTILMTIFENFSSSMLMPMHRIFRALAEGFSTHSVKPGDLDQHFQLIHCLIMSPMKGTARPVFRMKLLSRLLACNPTTARLITVAADRALQRQVTEGSTREDPESCRKWASLLTVRWTIIWLEKEHARYREARRLGSSLAESTDVPLLSGSDDDGKGHQGVDYRAIERSLRCWDDSQLPGALMVS